MSRIPIGSQEFKASATCQPSRDDSHPLGPSRPGAKHLVIQGPYWKPFWEEKNRWSGQVPGEKGMVRCESLDLPI